ncbi:MAG: response regulator [Terriglobia bacterium]|jgi:DNA-binding NtrC family response regulator
MTSGNGKPHLYPAQFLVPRGRILLVDEDEHDLEYFTTLLARMGYSVRAFMDYREAEGCLDREPFAFIVVSPAIDPHGLIELALARSGHTPEVVLRRCLEMNCCVAALQLGAADYIEKSLSPTEFEHLVTTHCQETERHLSRPPSRNTNLDEQF